MIRSLERPLGARRTPAPPLDEHPLVRRAARWRPTLAQVWAAVPFGVAAWWPGLMGLEPLDYWWTVKMGELIWQTGALPVSDPLTHTPIREPVIAGQWLAQLLLSAVHAAGGSSWP